jgi:hypothetical protein
MMRIPTDNPIKIRGEMSGLESIQLEEIIGLKNSRSPSPQIRSTRTISNLPKVSRMPGETGAPNPLFDLITIYDDEESSEVLLVTLVPIIEEKEIEKASSLSPDYPIQNLLQSDHEVESVLEIEFLNLPGNPKDSSRDEIALSGQKEEAQ